MYTAKRFISFISAGRTWIFDRILSAAFPMSSLNFTEEDLKSW